MTQRENVSLREELSRFGENYACFFRTSSFATSVYRTNSRFLRRCFPEKKPADIKNTLQARDRSARFGLEQINPILDALLSCRPQRGESNLLKIILPVVYFVVDIFG